MLPLDETLSLCRRELWREPMRPVGPLDGILARGGESKGAPVRCAGHVGRLAGLETAVERPSAEQAHRLGHPVRVDLDELLQVPDPGLTPPVDVRRRQPMASNASITLTTLRAASAASAASRTRRASFPALRSTAIVAGHRAHELDHLGIGAASSMDDSIVIRSVHPS